MSQELRLIKRDSDYINPFKKEEVRYLTKVQGLLYFTFRASGTVAVAMCIRSHWLGGSTSTMMDTENDDKGFAEGNNSWS